MPVVLVPAIVFYALVMSNVGTAYRNRAQFIPFILVYAAEGIVAWHRKRARRHSPRVQHAAGSLGLASQPQPVGGGS
jgi:hypothetical protein